jgi:DNA-binding beta-propeller fold protein YncE
VTAAPPGWLPDTGTGPEAVIREARRRQRRRWLAAGAAVAVAVAAVVSVIAGSGAGSRPRPPGHRALPTAPGHGAPPPAHAATLTVVSQTSLPKGNSLSLVAGYHAVWVTGIGVTYQVDEATGRIVRTIRTPGTFPDGCGSGIAAGAGAVWVTHACRGVYRIDPHSGRVTASLRVPDVGDSIVVASGLVWVTSYHGDLLRIQPRTNQVTGKPIRVGFGDWAMVPAGGALWVTSFGNGSASGTLSRVNLATGAVEPFGNLDIEAAGAGSLWTPYVQRIDPATGRVTASVPVAGTGPAWMPLVFWKGSAWALTVQRSLAVLRIDPATNQVTGKPVPVGKPVPIASGGGWPTAVAAGPTGLWAIDFMRNLLFHLAMRPARP